MNVSLKYHASVSRDLDADTAARNRAARAELPCSECGSVDGMQSGWTRELWSQTNRPTNANLLKHFLKLVTLFHCQDDDHELYQTCWQCNPNSIIPTNFEPLTPEQVAMWLGRECQCPDCRRERK